MSSIVEFLKIGRTARAAALVVVLGCFLVWWKLFGQSGVEISRVEHKATIEQIDKVSYTVKLYDGRIVRVPRIGYVDRGDKVVILERKFKAGETEFSLSLELTQLAE